MSSRLAKLEDEVRALRAEIDGILVDVAEELTKMAAKVDHLDGRCTEAINAVIRLDKRRVRRGK